MSANKENIERIQAIPGNHICVDCAEPNPEWASINLGILMCLTCSGVHRSLGTHITKVRSLVLDVECWKGELLEFMCSIGNAAFNRVWEIAAGSHILRPNHYPDIQFIRQYFIIRKYQNKAFMYHPYQNSVIMSSLKAQPWERSGYLTKLGGKENALFHSWQKRFLCITAHRTFTYAKTPTSEAAGFIDLAAPMQQLPAIEHSKEANEFVFSMSTPVDGTHEGRKFLFKCESEADRVGWMESLRAGVDPQGAFAIVSVSMQGLNAPHSLEAHVHELCTRHYQHIWSCSRVQSSPPACLPADLLKAGVLLFKQPQQDTWSARFCFFTFDCLFVTHSDSEEAWRTCPSLEVPQASTATSTATATAVPQAPMDALAESASRVASEAIAAVEAALSRSVPPLALPMPLALHNFGSLPSPPATPLAAIPLKVVYTDTNPLPGDVALSPESPVPPAGSCFAVWSPLGYFMFAAAAGDRKEWVDALTAQAAAFRRVSMAV